MISESASWGGAFQCLSPPPPIPCCFAECGKGRISVLISEHIIRIFSLKGCDSLTKCVITNRNSFWIGILIRISTAQTEFLPQSISIIKTSHNSQLNETIPNEMQWGIISCRMTHEYMSISGLLVSAQVTGIYSQALTISATPPW